MGSDSLINAASSSKLQASSQIGRGFSKFQAHRNEEATRIQDFKNLKVWRKSHAMTLDVYRTSLQFPGYECRPLIQQLQSSALSVESNIMEGATRGGDIEFRRFSKIALSSACELEGQMLIARDLGYLDPDTYSRMNLLCEEVRKMLWGLILRLGGFQS